MSFIYPVVAILVDYLAFDHHLQAIQLAGIAAVLIVAAGMTLGWSWWKGAEVPAHAEQLGERVGGIDGRPPLP